MVAGAEEVLRQILLELDGLPEVAKVSRSGDTLVYDLTGDSMWTVTYGAGVLAKEPGRVLVAARDLGDGICLLTIEGKAEPYLVRRITAAARRTEPEPPPG